MVKEYFRHDYNARNDKKMVRLKQEHRMKGIGIYWCLVEMLFEESGKLKISDIEFISGELKEKKEIIKSIVFDFELFAFDEIFFWSNGVINRLSDRKGKSDQASEAAKKRWRIANGMRTHTDRNASIGEDRIEENSIGEDRIEKGPDQNIIYSIEHCLTIALNDPRWVKANKATVEKLKEFNAVLEKTGVYKKNPMDYKKHFANWFKKTDSGDEKIKSYGSKSGITEKEKRDMEYLATVGERPGDDIWKDTTTDAGS